MVTFRITSLQHGWANATLCDGFVTTNLLGSYISDALGDLVRATLCMTSGQPDANCSWLTEPGEYRLSLHQTASELTVSVHEFHQSHPRQPDASGTELFSSEVPLERWVRQLLSEFQRLIDALGNDGYQLAWSKSHAFPEQELLDLRRWLKSLPPVDPPANPR